MIETKLKFIEYLNFYIFSKFVTRILINSIHHVRDKHTFLKNIYSRK